MIIGNSWLYFVATYPRGTRTHDLVRLLEKANEQREFGATVLIAYLRESFCWPRLVKLMNLPETAAKLEDHPSWGVAKPAEARDEHQSSVR